VTSPHDAAKAAKKLVSAWPRLNVPDPVGYAASLGAILEQYPLGVVEQCCDPARGLAREREFPPTVASIVEWCDLRVKRHRGAIFWGRLDETGKVEAAKYTESHERGMLKRLQYLMRGLWNSEKAQQAAE
jgi:hypothetical protein